MAVNYKNSTIDQPPEPGGHRGVYQFADAQYEIQRTNNFEFIVTDLTGTDNTYAGGSGKSHGEVIRLSLSKAFVPSFSQSAIEVKRGNTTIKFAGVPTYENGSIDLYDYIGMDALAALQAWQNKSYNVTTEKVGLVADYKKTCSIIEYTPDGQTVRKFTLYGCWISSLTQDELNYETNSAHKIHATIQYDKAIPDSDPNVKSSV